MARSAPANARSMPAKPRKPLPWPRPRPHAVAPEPAREGSATRTDGLCRSRLLPALAVAEALPAFQEPSGCGIADPVRLTAVLTRDRRPIAIRPPALLSCSAAETVALWLREDVLPARPSERPQVAEVSVAASFECRPRNRQAGGKLSQHARGEALDVTAFIFADGRRLELADGSSDRRLREFLRKTACARFATVLGPGSDGYHEHHVHLDVLLRPSGYRICQWNLP
ncbi:MAG TPA: extensin family protein [Xanthobacteraceae bacterium]|nr:extensin family protein [Xanthobacteraceae bacterium]